MEKDRLVASDGVIAVIITIMVLELKTPRDASLGALAGSMPVFLSYVLSFVSVAIYWCNHHHFFHLVHRVNGGMLWANLNLLFWMSLIPFTTSWVGEYHNEAIPAAVYGISFLMPALAWYLMQAAIIRAQGRNSDLAQALGSDIKGKVSPLLYIAGILLAFVEPLLSYVLYASVAVMWLVPDRRVERALR